MKLITASLLLLPTLSYGNYSFKHPSCVLRVLMKKEPSKLEKLFTSRLKSKKFQVKELIDQKRLFPGEMYSLFQVNKKDKKLYKDCSVKVLIKQAKTRYILDTDPILYEKEVKRSFPRMTFKGNERCTYALKDVFVHIPSCQTN